jgi:hypothetical protein
MTIKTVFRFIIKAIGLYILVELISLNPLMRLSSSSFDYENLLYLGLPVILYAVIIYLFLNKTDSVLSFLKLEEGLENEKINETHYRELIIFLLVFVTGFYFCSKTVFSILYSLIYSITHYPDNNYSISFTDVILFGIGVYLIYNTKKIMEIIKPKK